jgi:hypothetical protein
MLSLAVVFAICNEKAFSNLQITPTKQSFSPFQKTFDIIIRDSQGYGVAFCY